MKKDQEIREIEDEIWSIFKEDYISDSLINKATKLISRWKNLTRWKTDKTPVLKKRDISILDRVPKYQIK